MSFRKSEAKFLSRSCQVGVVTGSLGQISRPLTQGLRESAQESKVSGILAARPRGMKFLTSTLQSSMSVRFPKHVVWLTVDTSIGIVVARPKLHPHSVFSSGV
jgi:hypothetical protein